MTIYALGDRIPVCHPDSWVADNATVVGSVRLAANASVWFGAVIRADNDLISIGEGSNVQDNAVLHADPGVPITVGRGVTIGHAAVLHGCTVGDGSLIGMGAVVLNRAVIGTNCKVGAGALVPQDKRYPDRTLILGSPARVVRDLTEEEVAKLQRDGETYLRTLRNYVTALRRL